MELIEWLIEVCKAHEVEPVTLNIGKTTYTGARYKQTLALQRVGTDETEHTREAIYVLGETPASWKRSRRTVYRLAGDPRDWFVASWVPEEVASSEQYGEFHFGEGPHFLMMPWRHEDPIDQHEERPYARIDVPVA